MPTRNRSHCIGDALRSALNQTVRDLEVVISDNGDDGKTKAIVDGFSDPRIRYAKTDRVLSMPDNFNNALAMATGEWILLLTDDSVLSSRCLELAEKALIALPSKLVTFSWCGYNPPDFGNRLRRNQFVILQHTGRARREDSAWNLERLYGFYNSDAAPRPYNACTHRSLIETLKSRLGSVYLPPAPDYTFLAAALALVDSFTFIDMPLMMTITGESPLASVNGFVNLPKELVENTRGGYAPVRMPVIEPWSVVAESIWRVKRTMNELERVPYDEVRYLVHLGSQIWEYKDYGFDVADSMQRYRDYMAGLPLRVRAKVRVAVLKARTRRQHRRARQAETLERTGDR